MRDGVIKPVRIEKPEMEWKQTEADLLPDLEKQTLTIRLHHLANVMFDNVIEKFCTELNATETRFPLSNWPTVFKLGSI